MSNTNTISVRIASKTRNFETCGDSSYYYSSQLISNLALLKAVSRLGQQLSWPSKNKSLAGAAQTKGNLGTQGSVFLAKANQSSLLSRVGPLINLKALPGKEWLSANLKLLSKLENSRQFFNSKAIGLLPARIGPPPVVSGSNATSPQRIRDFGSPVEKSVRTGGSLYGLAKFGGSKFYKQERDGLINKLVQKNLSSGKESRISKAKGSLEGFFAPTGIESISAYNSVYGTPNFNRFSGLPFYLTALLMVCTSGYAGQKNDTCDLPAIPIRQALRLKRVALRSSLVVAPIIGGAVQMTEGAEDSTALVKLTSSSGLGLVSKKPKCYLSRSPKKTALNFFFRLPAGFSTGETGWPFGSYPGAAPPADDANQVYIWPFLNERANQVPKAQRGPSLKTYASIRWS